MISKHKKRQLYWLSRERGTVIKAWGEKLRIALAFPNRYALGMSNLGFQSVYSILNEHEGVVCERVFYPEPEDLLELTTGNGKLLTVESQAPLDRFDLVAFSVSFENDYSNVLGMLKLASIPLKAEERNAAQPYVAAGGVAVFLNPEPLAPFMDFIFVGEGEALLPDFFREMHGLIHGGLPRGEVLLQLGRSMKGLYVPSFYESRYGADGALIHTVPLHSGLPERIRFQRADLSKSRPCATSVHTPETEFSDSTLVEIGRGCGRGCRFCAAGFVYRPMRVHELTVIEDCVRSSSTGMGRLGLVSAAVSDHPEISDLCRLFLNMGKSLSFSSLRADRLTEDMIDALQAGGHHSVAIAPEAGSDRLRRVINKDLSQDHIVRAAELLAERGIMQLKLYFMVGLPTEQLDDLEAIVDLTKLLKHHVLKVCRPRTRLGTITLSIHSFVPKAFTPFQWTAFAGVRDLKDRAAVIQKGLRKVPNVRVHFDMPRWAYVQAVLARGDRRASLLLEKVTDGMSWSQAMRHVPFNPDYWVMRERGHEEHFPWEIIDHGVRRGYLWKEYQQALSEIVSPSCVVGSGCRACGACES